MSIHVGDENSKNIWSSEILRSLAQLRYWHCYRYAKPRGTALSYVNDVLAYGPACETVPGASGYEGATWHERNYAGYHDTRSGRYVFTKPGPERMAAMLAYLEDAGVITEAALAPHAGDMNAAVRHAAQAAYDRYANAAYFAGRLRGQFLGTRVANTEIIHSVLLIHLLAGENYFRVRDLRIAYRHDEDESAGDFKARGRSMVFDAYEVRDFFAVTGTEHGAMFLRNGPNARIDSYDWNGKNTRIHAFTAHEGDRSEMRYVLCRQPWEIDFSLDILRAVSGFVSVSRAAE